MHVQTAVVMRNGNQWRHQGGGGHGGHLPPPVRGFAPPLAPPPSQNGIFFFFFFFFTYDSKSHQSTNLKLMSAFSAISVSINKVIHRRSIVYTMVWHNLRKIHESHSYRCFMVYLWVCSTVSMILAHSQRLFATYIEAENGGSEKRKSKIFQGLRPLDPPAGALPLHPARGPKAGPWTPPKIGSRLRARYVRSALMFAPQKNRLALTRSLCTLRAHLCPPKKKNRLALTRSLGALRAYVCPKKSARAYALAMCAPRTCLPPHNISLPPSCPPPLFKSWCRHWWEYINHIFSFTSYMNFTRELKFW